MNTKPFDLEAALRGEAVYHVGRGVHVENVTRVGNRVAFTIPNDGDSIYNCLLNGNNTNWPKDLVLTMKPKTRTIYVNIWDSPSFHYTKYPTLEAAKQDMRGVSANSKSHLRHKKLNPEPFVIEVEER